MKSSESIKNLAEALCNAQATMGGAVKDSANPFFKSSYADLTSVIKAIKDPFAKNGLSYTQFPISNEHGVGVCTRLMHNSGEWIEEEFVLPLVKRDPQSGGSCLTYCRRYSLQSLAGIPVADDDAESAMLRGSQVSEKLSQDQIDDIKGLLEETNTDVKKFLGHFKAKSVDDMLVVQYSRAMAALTSKLK
jgi:hypothetical protein